MFDVDDFDPLDDILLSDEEQLQHATVISENFTKPLKHEMNVGDKRKKIFEELFGTGNEKTDTVENKSEVWLLESKENKYKSEGNLDDTSTPKPEFKKSNSHSWLGLFDEEKDSLTEQRESKDILTNNVENPSLLDSGNIEGKHEISVTSSSLDWRKPKNSLPQKNTNLKSFKINLEEDENTTNAEFNQMEKSKVGLWNIEIETSSTSNSGLDKTNIRNEIYNRPVTTPGISGSSYVPSAGVNRRLALRKSLGSSLSLDLLDPPDTVSPSVKASSVKNDSSEKLPTWLKDVKTITPDMKARPPENQQILNNDEQNEVAISYETENHISNIENVAPSGPIKPIDDINYTKIESHKKQSGGQFDDLSNIMNLKKKQSELRDQIKHQAQLLSRHDQEIRETVLKLISQQYNGINSLMDVISGDAVSNRTIFSELNQNSDTKNHEDGSENNSLNLNKKIGQLERENEILKLRLQYMEQKIDLEISSLEDSYQCKLNLATQRELQLKSELSALDEDHKARILKLKDNEAELIRIHNDRIARIDEERMIDLKRIKELNEMIRMCPEHDIPNKRKVILTDAELSSREELLINKERKLSELEETLNRDKMAIETKKANLEEKLEEFEIKRMKDKFDLEQQRKELRYSKSILLQKEEAWKHEKEREEHFLSSYKQQIEDAKENLLREEKKISKQKFDLATEKSRLDAFTKMEGISPSHLNDIIQARAEVHAVIEEARNMKLKLEDERKLLKNYENKLKEEKIKLQEAEEELNLKAKRLERLFEQSNAKREEGIQALRKVKRVESEINNKLEEISEKLIELHNKEEKIMSERMHISRERELLHKYKSECVNPILLNQGDSYAMSDVFLPPYPALMNQSIINPKCLILKLKAEQMSDDAAAYAKIREIS